MIKYVIIISVLCVGLEAGQLPSLLNTQWQINTQEKSMNNQITSEKKYTVKEISEMINVPEQTIKNSIRRIYPDKMQNGKITYLNEIEISNISKDMKIAHNSNLSRTGQVPMTELEENDHINQAMILLVNRAKRLKAQVEELKPKAEICDKLIETHNTVSMAEFAKTIGWGRNIFLNKLRSLEIMNFYNIPYQPYMKYFEVRQIVKNGKTYSTSFINAKGMKFLTKLIGNKI